jgi:hypothetical protein
VRLLGCVEPNHLSAVPQRCRGYADRNEEIAPAFHFSKPEPEPLVEDIRHIGRIRQWKGLDLMACLAQ